MADLKRKLCRLCIAEAVRDGYCTEHGDGYRDGLRDVLELVDGGAAPEYLARLIRRILGESPADEDAGVEGRQLSQEEGR